MTRDDVIAVLRANAPELQAAGVISLSVFGSAARNEMQAGSDVDLLVKLDERASAKGFAHYARLEAIKNKLETILARDVDLVTEPINNSGLKQSIELEGAFAF